LRGNGSVVVAKDSGYGIAMHGSDFREAGVSHSLMVARRFLECRIEA